MRKFLYILARLIGDVDAIAKGRIGKRLARRSAGRMTGSILRKLFK